VSALAVVALFGAGLLSFASPCVLPLVPAWVAIAAGDVDDPQALRWGTAWFVGGFTLVFVMLGTLAGRIGGIVDPAQTWIVRIGGLLLVGFGLALMGLPLDRLGGDVRLVRALPSGTGGLASTAWRAAVTGVAFGAAWTPCVGPLLGAALVAAGGSGGAAPGAVLLFFYSLGVGLPFVAAALAYAAWPGAQRRLRPLAGRLRTVAGAVLAILGLAVALGAVDRLFSPAARLVPA
jgi:cytochrome c-type biogenesis protein